MSDTCICVIFRHEMDILCTIYLPKYICKFTTSFCKFFVAIAFKIYKMQYLHLQTGNKTTVIINYVHVHALAVWGFDRNEECDTYVP